LGQVNPVLPADPAVADLRRVLETEGDAARAPVGLALGKRVPVGGLLLHPAVAGVEEGLDHADVGGEARDDGVLDKGGERVLDRVDKAGAGGVDGAHLERE